MPTPITSHYLRRIIAQLKEKDIDFKPEDNILNDHDRYAYHLQLVMVNDRDSESLDVDIDIHENLIRYIIVAESGVTAGFNITECTIEDAVSHGFRNKNGHSVKINLTIAEPYNMSLPDKLFEASKQLNVLNWRLAPMFLLLWFEYYDSEGKIKNNDQDSILKVYKLNIVEMNNTLTAAGSIYNLDCAISNNLGFTNTYYIIPQTYTIAVGGQATPAQAVAGRPALPNLTGNTIGQFFENLGIELNKFYANLRQGGPPDSPVNQQTAQVVFYEFVVDPELAKQKIKFTPNVNNRRAGFRQVGNVIEITVGRGISIGNLVDDVCSSISDPKFFIADNQSGIINVPWVECVVTNIGWDQLLNDYIRQFTFHINIKQTRRPVPSPIFGRTFQLVEEFERARLQSIDQENLLRKAYLYFYTGNNTEIINLEVKFNHLHVIPQSLTNNTVLPSVFSAQQATLPGVQQALAQRANVENQRTRLGNEVQRLLNNNFTLEERRTVPDLQTYRDTRLAELNRDLVRLDDETARLQRIIADQSLVIFDPFDATRIEAQVGSLGQFIPRTANLREELAQQRQAARQRRPRQEFAEDLTNPSQLVGPAQLTYLADPRDLVNFVRSPNSDAEGESRKLYTNVLSQIYERKSDMVNINMEIRGDPYWLGQDNLERNRILQTNKDAPGALEPNTTLFTSYEPYDAFFVLGFRAGTIPNETTGFMDLNDDVDFFNALYLVVNVTHIFRNGQFIQRLEATRDNLSNLGGNRPAPVAIVPPQGVGPQVVR